MKMTETEAIEYVATHGDDDVLDPEELDACFAAIFGREPDDEDRAEGLWSHCCQAMIDVEDGHLTKRANQ